MTCLVILDISFRPTRPKIDSTCWGIPEGIKNNNDNYKANVDEEAMLEEKMSEDTWCLLVAMTAPYLTDRYTFQRYYTTSESFYRWNTAISFTRFFCYFGWSAQSGKHQTRSASLTQFYPVIPNFEARRRTVKLWQVQNMASNTIQCKAMTAQPAGNM